MALSDSELQDILGGLTLEEQKQLFERLGQQFNDDNKPPQPKPQPQKSDSDKVYCCIACGSANYKRHGTTSKGMQGIT